MWLGSFLLDAVHISCGTGTAFPLTGILPPEEAAKFEAFDYFRNF